MPDGKNFDDIFLTDQELVDRYIGNGLWTSGQNDYGQLGDGSTTNRSSPVTTSGGGANWKMVSFANTSAVAVKTDGTLWTWGRNDQGQLGTGNTTNRSSPGTTAGGGTTWLRTAAGNNHIVAVRIDGSLWCWGRNTNGQLGDGSTTVRSSPVTTSGGGLTWFNVGCGSDHTIATKTDGTLWTWGLNTHGQLGDGTTTNRSSPVTVAGGGTNWRIPSTGGLEFSSAVKSDGTLWTWGRNQNGQLGDGTTTNRSSPGTTAGGGTNWDYCGNGAFFNAALKVDGTIWTWGLNTYGQLGDGTTNNRSSPGTTAGGGTDWRVVNTGDDSAYGIKTNGTLWTWGRNQLGQLGDGSTTNRSSPGSTLSESNWYSVGHGAAMLGGVADR